jgi:glycosyltransferase involved in cell wall biosynthesis
MTATWNAWYRSLKDDIRHHPLVRRMAASGLWLRSCLTRQSPTQRLLTLTQAAHLCPTGPAFDSLCRLLRKEMDRLDPADIEWRRITRTAANTSDVPKGILLKAPVSASEKGVLHVPFEDQWLRLFRSDDRTLINRMAEEYDLVLGPSWSPPPEPALVMAATLWPGRLYTLLSNFADAERMRAVSDRLEPVPLLASSWVDPISFEPHLGQDRDIDIVMLANFGAFKRHWLLFDALRSLPRSYRIRLLGVPMDGRGETHLRKEAELYGVADRFEVVVKPTREEIAQSLARARVSIILSRREGSCVAVAESLFADTPVGLVQGCQIGSTAYINDRTGCFLRESHLAEDLHRFVAQADTYRPRSWALSHITCRHSIARLNHLLREHARQEGRPWTRDLELFAQDTLSIYPDPDRALAMQPHIDAFERNFGFRLGRGMRRVLTSSPLVAVA